MTSRKNADEPGGLSQKRALPPAETRVSHRISVSSVLQRDGRFLVIEEMVNDVQRLSQPAGPLQAGESPSEGAVRESLAQSGVAFVPSHLVGIYQWYLSATNTTHLRLCYTGTIYVPGGTPPKPSDPHIFAVRWLTPEQLLRAQGRHESVFVMQCVRDYVNGARYPLEIVSNLQASMLDS